MGGLCYGSYIAINGPVSHPRGYTKRLLKMKKAIELAMKKGTQRSLPKAVLLLQHDRLMEEEEEHQRLTEEGQRQQKHPAAEEKLLSTKRSSRSLERAM